MQDIIREFARLYLHTEPDFSRPLLPDSVVNEGRFRRENETSILIGALNTYSGDYLIIDPCYNGLEIRSKKDVDYYIYCYRSKNYTVNYVLPEDFRVFISAFTSPFRIRDDITDVNECPPDDHNIYGFNLNHAYEYMTDTIELMEEYNKILPDDKELVIYMEDYISFYFDGFSADNGHGEALINCNPDSILYGNILLYASSDDGRLELFTGSFSEFLKVYIDNYSRFVLKNVVFSFVDNIVYRIEYSRSEDGKLLINIGSPRDALGDYLRSDDSD